MGRTCGLLGRRRSLGLGENPNRHTFRSLGRAMMDVQVLKLMALYECNPHPDYCRLPQMEDFHTRLHQTKNNSCHNSCALVGTHQNRLTIVSKLQNRLICLAVKYLVISIKAGIIINKEFANQKLSYLCIPDLYPTPDVFCAIRHM